MKSKLKYYLFLFRFYKPKELQKLFINRLIIKNDQDFMNEHQYIFDIWNTFSCRRENNYLILNHKQSDIFLRLGTSDLEVFNQIYIKNEYKKIIKILKEKSTKVKALNIIDLGANIGLASLILSQSLRYTSILAVEPDLGNFEMMNKNLSNQNVINVQAAVWSSSKKLTLDRTFRDGKDWAIRVIDEGQNENNVHEIQAHTLKSLVCENEFKQIDFLKIDIEGAEKELFLNDPDFLNIVKTIDLIAIEVHEEYIKEITVINILKELNFNVSKSGEYIIAEK